MTLVVVQPGMPESVVLLTGPEGSAYHDLGVRYADDLRQRGLGAEVVITDGAYDNLLTLASDGRSVAFAPSTLDWDEARAVDASELVTLGSVGFEPLWLFHRAELDIARLADLADRRVASPGPETAADHVARKMLAANGLDADVALVPLADPDADAVLRDLASGALDAVFATGTWTSPVVATLLDAESVSFVSFERADAYSTRIPGIIALTAPRGVFDLEDDVPPRDARLVASTTCLVAYDSLHPAVVPMLLATAENVGAGIPHLPTATAFPSSEHATLPLEPAARRFFQQGEVGLSKFLPYPVTRFLDHLGFLVLPILTVVALLLKLVPTAFRIRLGLHLKRLLVGLVRIEKEHAGGADAAGLLAELDELDRASVRVFVPRSSAQEYLEVRQILHDLRDRVSG